jgi:hypothetical protein
MATERVYHPETCEPFDVTPSKASVLVLEKGWSRTPWTRTAVAPEPVVEETARGRGRRRRTVEAEPVIEFSDEAVEVTHASDAEADDLWRN